MSTDGHQKGKVAQVIGPARRGPDLVDDAIMLAVIDADDAFEKLEVVSGFACGMQQRGDVLREA